MKIKYDKEIDALSIIFIDTTVTTVHINNNIAIDYAQDGKVAGIEILDVSATYMPIDILNKIEFENIVH